jgi:hypothetical protein
VAALSAPGLHRQLARQRDPPGAQRGQQAQLPQFVRAGHHDLQLVGQPGGGRVGGLGLQQVVERGQGAAGLEHAAPGGEQVADRRLELGQAALPHELLAERRAGAGAGAHQGGGQPQAAEAEPAEQGRAPLGRDREGERAGGEPVGRQQVRVGVGAGQRGDRLDGGVLVAAQRPSGVRNPGGDRKHVLAGGGHPRIPPPAAGDPLRVDQGIRPAAGQFVGPGEQNQLVYGLSTRPQSVQEPGVPDQMQHRVGLGRRLAGGLQQPGVPQRPARPLDHHLADPGFRQALQRRRERRALLREHPGDRPAPVVEPDRGAARPHRRHALPDQSIDQSGLARPRFAGDRHPQRLVEAGHLVAQPVLGAGVAAEGQGGPVEQVARPQLQIVVAHAGDRSSAKDCFCRPARRISSCSTRRARVSRAVASWSAAALAVRSESTIESWRSSVTAV